MPIPDLERTFDRAAIRHAIAETGILVITALAVATLFLSHDWRVVPVLASFLIRLLIKCHEQKKLMRYCDERIAELRGT
jgi:hypothetical protein